MLLKIELTHDEVVTLRLALVERMAIELDAAQQSWRDEAYDLHDQHRLVAAKASALRLKIIQAQVDAERVEHDAPTAIV
jgi:hypothetical protein